VFGHKRDYSRTGHGNTAQSVAVESALLNMTERPDSIEDPI
jgi:hypothetical protein